MNFPSYYEKLSIVNKSLQDYFPDDAYPPLLYDAMKYSIFSGGKRLRSVLCLFSYELFDPNFEAALPCALALEFIHTYSLIHDDLPAIDNDDLRRGRPTCHKKFGEDVAILAGDSLFAEAFMVVAKDQTGTPEQVKKVLAELAEATGANGMVGGQVVDVISEGNDIDENTLNYIHTNKTGKLIKASAVIGAITGGAKDNEIEIISSYAQNLGLSFQITDDILDLTMSTKELGKPANSDTKLKKATYPSILGLEKAKEKAIEHRDYAIDIISKLDKKQNLTNLAYYVTDRSH